MIGCDFMQHTYFLLTHLSLIPHTCVRESGQHWFRLWLVAYPPLSHYVNQRLFIVNWTIRNKQKCNFNKNTQLFIHENASETILCDMAAILSRGGGGGGGGGGGKHVAINQPRYQCGAISGYILFSIEPRLIIRSIGTGIIGTLQTLPMLYFRHGEW